MKKTGKITSFDGGHGLINDKSEEFDFHISDFSTPEPAECVQLGDLVEFRAEYRELNVKRAKNIKVLQKKPASRTVLFTNNKTNR